MTRSRSKGHSASQHGLSAQVAYTWQKELTNGTNSNTSYVTPSPPLINDVFNKALDKQISGFSIPQELIIAFNYITPRIARRWYRDEGSVVDSPRLDRGWSAPLSERRS